MGYDVRITRDPLTGTGRQIHLEEWFKSIGQDGELLIDVATSPDPERYPATSILWTGHPEAGSEEATQTLHYGAGDIFVAYPDMHLMKKMVLLARQLKAVVIGDNGELYDLDANGDVITHDDGRHHCRSRSSTDLAPVLAAT